MTRPGNLFPKTGRMALLAVVFALTPIENAYAAGISMDAIPTIRLEEGWNSNVYDSSTNGVSSFGTRVTPGLALRFTSPEMVALEVSGRYEILRYSDSEAKNADGNTWFFRINSTGEWALTQNLSMLPSVYYLNTTDSTRRTQLVPSGDPTLPPVTITNYGDTKTENFGGAVNFNYQATQNMTIGVNANYSEQRFSDNTSSSGLTNSTTIGGNTSVSYIFSPRTTLGILVAGNHQTYENAPDSDTLSGGILFGYQFSPAFRIDGAFGWSFIRQSEAPGIPEQKDSAPSGLFRVTYTSDTFTANMYGSAVYSGGGGYGGSTRQWTAGLGLADRFTRDWSWNLSGAYQVSRSVFVTDAVNINTLYGTVGLTYRPWEWGGFDLTGNLNRQSSDGQFGSDVNTYAAILGFTIGKAYKIF